MLRSLCFPIRAQRGSYNIHFRRHFSRPANPLRTQSPPSPSTSNFALENNPSFASKVGKPSIRNQVLFFLFGSSAVFFYAAFKTELDTSLLVKQLGEQSPLMGIGSLTNRDLARIQQMELVKDLRLRYAELNRQMASFPPLLRDRFSKLYLAIFQPYADASQGRRLCWKICLLNFGVWVLFKMRPMAMMRNFSHLPLSGRSFTMLTSMFGHHSFIHLAMNCLALESFGSAAYTYLSKAQTQETPDKLEASSSNHFVAFFLTAGVFSSLVSHVASVKFKYPRLIAQLASPSNVPKATDTWASAVAASSNNTSRSMLSALSKPKPIPNPSIPASTIPASLGASGAIYACVTMTALAFPQAQISLIIPPSYPIDIQTGVLGLVALDMIGIMRGWRLFDHWAHLGGAAFGAAYYAYGPKLWTRLRDDKQG